jgi:hypothetical protein
MEAPVSAKKLCLLSSVMAAAFWLAGCGSSSKPVSIALSPASATVDATDTVALTANVTNDKNAAGVSWSVSGGGTLSNTSLTAATYTAPAASSTPLSVTVTAQSIADGTKTATAAITVPAAPAITTASLPAGAVGAAYTVTLAGSGGIAPYTWSLAPIPPGLTWTPATATLAGTPLATAAGSTNLTFKLTDSGAPNALSASQTLSLTVAKAAAIVFSTGAALPAGTQNVAYSGSIAASGGAGTLSYAVTAGALPAGVLLSTSGALAGTPSAAGSFNFTVTASDAFGDSQAQQFSLNIAYPPVSVAVLPVTSTLDGADSVSLTASVTNDRGAAGVNWSVTGGGALSNVTTTSATYTAPAASNAQLGVTVTATSNVDNTKSATSSITVPAAPAITNTSLAGGAVGSSYSAQLAGSGGIPPYSWSVSGGKLPSGLSMTSGGAISGTPTAAGAGTTPVTFKLTDSGAATALTATAQLNIAITAASAFNFTGVMPAAATYNVLYTGSAAATGGAGTLTYSQSGSWPAWLKLNTVNGSVAGTPTATGSFSFTVQVADAFGDSATQPYTILVSYPAMNIVAPSLSTAYAGSVYASPAFTATGGTGVSGNYNWSAAGLPAGLSIGQTTGIISGSPTGAPGTTNFTVTVTDTVANISATSPPLPITVAAGVSISTATTGTALQAYASSPYALSLAGAASGGAGGPYTWTVTSGSSLPSWLSLQGTTLSGIPAATAPAVSFSLTATDTVGNSASQVYQITVSAGVSISAPILPQAYPGVAYTSPALTATGGAGGPYTWSWAPQSGSSLPSGTAWGIASASATTGVISGNPSNAGSSSVTSTIIVTAKDAAGNSATAIIALTIEATLSITSGATLPGGVVNIPYSVTLGASGGAGGYGWATDAPGTASLASLNLALSNNGIVSGTPLAPGSASFTATVTDFLGHTANLLFTVAVTNALTITTTSLPPAYAGASYSQQLSAAGGSGKNYTWSVSVPGNLASFNLSLSNAGVLSGIPSAGSTGTVTFTAKVTDSAQNTATFAYSIPVYAPLTMPTTNPATLGPAIVGVPYTGTITATGGSGGDTWIVTGLPGYGLNYSSNGGVLTISGTPATATTVQFTAKVTDSLGNTQGPTFFSVVISSQITMDATALPLSADASSPYSGVIRAAGGSGSYTWTVAGLPANGLKYSNNGGALTISGTPTFNVLVPFSVKVADTSNAANSVGANPYSITVYAALTLPAPNPATLVSANQNQSYSGQIYAGGGSGSGYSWTVNGSPVPTDGSQVSLASGLGLYVTNNGSNDLVVGGTPNAAGTVSFTASVQDSTGATVSASAPYTIAVNPPGSTINGNISLNNNCGNGTVPAITVTLTNTATNSQTQTTTSNGNYSFTGVPAGTYTITPSITGPSSVFYPAAQSVTVSGNTQTNNFLVTLGYTVSGTASYSGKQTSGQIYLLLASSNCGNFGAPGTSVPYSLAGSGAFTIHGVPPGTYTLQAWMDALNTGAPNVVDPSGSTSNVSVNNQNTTGVAVTLTDPTVTVPANGPSLKVITANAQGVTIDFSPVVNSNSVEAVTSYTVQWAASTSSFSSAAQYTFAADGSKGVWLLNNLLPNNSTGFTSGQSYYFRARGVLPSGNTAWTTYGGSSPTAVTIAAPAAANTITGTVTFNGAATGPLYVGFYDQSTGSIYATAVGTRANPPVSPAPFTVNVPSGSNYFFFGIIDQNNNGLIDAGDITNTNNSNSTSTTIAASGTMNLDLTHLTNSTGTVNTQNTKYIDMTGKTTNSYSLNMNVRAGIKLPVAAELTAASNPNVLLPVDISACTTCGTMQFSYQPNIVSDTPKVNDTYTFNVTYSDGSTGTTTATVTGVETAFATLGAPLGSVPGNTTPTFTWTDPSNSSNYLYQFWLCCDSNGTIWQIPGNNSNSNGFSNSILSIVWGTDPTGGGSSPTDPSLTSGTTYTWSIEVLNNTTGNSTQTQASFQP